MKTRIDIAEVRRLQARIREINALDLRDIEWVEDGQVLDISPGTLERWRFMGMTNTCFIDTEFYKNGFVDDSDAAYKWARLFDKHCRQSVGKRVRYKGTNGCQKI